MVGKLIRLSVLCCISSDRSPDTTSARALSISALKSSLTSSSSTILKESVLLFTSSFGELLVCAAGTLTLVESVSAIEDRGVPEGVMWGEGFSGLLSFVVVCRGGFSGWSGSVRIVGSFDALALLKVDDRLTPSSSG